MLRHIAWFNEAPVEPCPEGSLTSPDTDTCRRCLAPARELEKLGVECSVFGNLGHADPAHVAQHLHKLASDIVVIEKASGPTMLKLAKAAKHLGCYLVLDIGHEAKLSGDVMKLADIADQLVAATSAAATNLTEMTGHETMVIPDCDEKSVGSTSPEVVAHAWLNCFKQLKMKPPQCANTNIPAGN